MDFGKGGHIQSRRGSLYAEVPVLTGCFPSKEDFVQTFLPGQYIKHSQYGCGVITESDPSRTTIDFDIHGIKKFVTSPIVVEPAEGRARRSKATRPAQISPTAVGGAN